MAEFPFVGRYAPSEQRAMKRQPAPQRAKAWWKARLVLLVFFALLLGVVDCGQVLFAHQALVERARSAVRWGVRASLGGPEPIVNLVLYGQTEEPRA